MLRDQLALSLNLGIFRTGNNLKTFTLKELKKEVIKMKADKFAVTRMKREQVVELIIA